MRWFLKLFPQYNQLLRRTEEAESQVRVLQMRVDSAELDQRKARDELTVALKRLANFQYLQAGSIGVPFPEVHVEMPRREEPTPEMAPMPGTPTMREMQRKAVAHSRRMASEAAQKFMAAQAAARDPLGLDGA